MQHVIEIESINAQVINDDNKCVTLIETMKEHKVNANDKFSNEKYLKTSVILFWICIYAIMFFLADSEHLFQELPLHATLLSFIVIRKHTSLALGICVHDYDICADMLCS